MPEVVELRRLFDETVELFDKATNPLVTRTRPGRASAARSTTRASAGSSPSAGFGLELDVILQPHPRDHLELVFERVDMMFLVLEDLW